MDKDGFSDKDDFGKKHTLPPLHRREGRHTLYNNGCRPLKRAFPFPPKPRENAGVVLQQLRNEGIIGRPSLIMPSRSEVFPSKYPNETVVRKFPRCLSTLVSPRATTIPPTTSKTNLANHLCPLQDEPRPKAFPENREDMGASGTLLQKKMDSHYTNDGQNKPTKVQRTERLGRPNTPLKKKCSRHRVKRVL